MIIQLANGTSFEVDNVNETKKLTSIRHNHQLVFNILNDVKENEYYENLLYADNALDAIEVSGKFGKAYFNNFTKISNLDRTIDENGVKLRIALERPEET